MTFLLCIIAALVAMCPTADLDPLDLHSVVQAVKDEGIECELYKGPHSRFVFKEKPDADRARSIIISLGCPVGVIECSVGSLGGWTLEVYVL